MRVSRCSLPERGAQRGLYLKVDNPGFKFAVRDMQRADGDWQPEAAGTSAPRIDVEHAALFLDQRLVRMSVDDSGDAVALRIDGEIAERVENEDAMAADGKVLGFRQ